ncbi:MAG: tetratricopeptide repeat protein [Myxococcota bacterium]
MRAALAALAIAVATLAVFAQTTGHDFLRWDDPVYVTENPLLRSGPTLDAMARAFAEPYEANWIPLTWISLQIDHAWHGLDPAGYHATNVALHLLASLLLHAALWRATGDPAPAAFVAAVFAVHPLHVESVAWVSERKDTLSAVFFALALWLHVGYARAPSTGRYLTVVAATALGLLTKPMLVTLPCVLLLLDAWPLDRLKTPAQRRLAVLEKLPLLALAALASIATVYAQQRYGSMDHGDLLDPALRVGNAVLSVVLYLRDAFWPSGLSVFYPHPQDALAWSAVAACGVLLLAISAAGLALRRRAPWLLVGWLWFLGMLVPVLGLVQVGMQGRADRYTYLPLVGLCLALAWSVDRSVRSPGARRAAGAAALCVVLALGVAAHRQTRHWRDTETLFRHAVAVDPDNWFAHQWVGSELLLRGAVEEAEQAFRRSAALRPEWAATHRGLADVYAERRDWTRAILHYERALRLRPRDAGAHMRLARALALSDQHAEALGRARHAVRLARGHQRAEALVILAFVHLERGEAEAALTATDQALGVLPDLPGAWSSRGLALLQLGRGGEARDALDRAIVLAEQQGNAALAAEIRARR